MVRETRHLWVGNLPENIREERIREHFKRYGRVQSVKLLPGSNGSLCAAVAFMDIKSASKAHNCEHTLDEHALSTEYYEPGPYTSSQQRFPIGIADEHSTFERTSHFYERSGGSTPGTPISSSGSRTEVDGYLRRSSVYHTPPDPLRGRPRERPYRNGPTYPPGTERSSCSNNRRNWVYDTGSVRYLTASSDEHGTGKSTTKKVRSGSESRSGSQSSRSRSPTRSSTGSPRSSDSSTRSDSPRSSTRVSVQSTVAPPVQQAPSSTTLAVYSEDRRPLAICVRNLPTRSSDTSLKDGLFHEYKKHGKVTWVKVVGAANDRYALVCFKKPEDVEKAIEVSQDKLFFGCKIDVAPYHGYDVEDNEARPYDTELDEYHPKATRTLFIGNLEKDVTAGDIRQHFDQFGEIIEIDIKKQPGVTSSYAFCQYADIGSVVQAMRTLDGEPLGESRLKLGFGKSMASSCVWIAGVAEQVSDKYLDLQFRKFGPVSHVIVDRERGQALIFFEQVSAAAAAVKEMRGVPLRGNRIQIDFASRECQEAFYERIDSRDPNWTSFETNSRSDRDGVSSRYDPRYRYDASRVRSSSYSRSSGSRTPRRHEVFDSPRYKSYEELSPTSDHDELSVGDSTDLKHLHKERNHLQHLLDQLDRPLRSVTAADQGLVVTTHNHRRRLSSSHQRPSGEGPAAPLSKRRKTGSTSEDERKKHHHQSGDESRPGTPLFDEKPDNIQPQEPRRVPRERPEEPLSLPLPQFAAQCFSTTPKPPPPTTTTTTTTSTPTSNLTHSTSGQPAPPTSPVRPPSPSSTSSSEVSPQSPTLEERIRSLDEKYEKWTGRTQQQPPVKPKHRLLDVDVRELQPSDIVKSVLAKPSVFDDDSKRLENFGEKYEPREFSSFSRSVGGLDVVPRYVPGDPRNPSYISNLSVKVSPLNSPSGALLSPCPAAKGLQYPFPSHPPVQPTTSVATTTAGSSSPPAASVVRPISKSMEFSVLKAESWLGINKSGDGPFQKDSILSSGGFAQRFNMHSKSSESSSAQRHNVMKLTDLATQKMDIPSQKSLDPRLEKMNAGLTTMTTSVLSQRLAVKSDSNKGELICLKYSNTVGSSNNIINSNCNTNNKMSSSASSGGGSSGTSSNHNNHTINNNSASNSNSNNSSSNNNDGNSARSASLTGSIHSKSNHNNNVDKSDSFNGDSISGGKRDGGEISVIRHGKDEDTRGSSGVECGRRSRGNSLGSRSDEMTSKSGSEYCSKSSKVVDNDIQVISEFFRGERVSHSSDISVLETRGTSKTNRVVGSESFSIFSSDNNKSKVVVKESTDGCSSVVQNCESTSTKKLESSSLKSNVSHSKTANVILGESEVIPRSQLSQDVVGKLTGNGSSAKTGDITASKISDNSVKLLNENDKLLTNKSASVHKDEFVPFNVRDKESGSGSGEHNEKVAKSSTSGRDRERERHCDRDRSSRDERSGRDLEKDRSSRDKVAAERDRDKEKSVRDRQRDREMPESVDKERKKDREVETERKKDRESMDVIERDKRKENDLDKERKKDQSDVLDRRKDGSDKKSQDSSERSKKRDEEKEKEKEKKKDRDTSEKRKDSHSSDKHKRNNEHEKRRESESDQKDRKKEKISSSSSSSSQPVVIGSKRRISSQDSAEGLEDAKRSKSEHKRRDSKDSKSSSFSNVSSSSSSNNKLIKTEQKSSESKSSSSSSRDSKHKHSSESASSQKSSESKTQDHKRKEDSDRRKSQGDVSDKKKEKEKDKDKDKEKDRDKDKDRDRDREKDGKKLQVKTEEVVKNSHDYNGKSIEKHGSTDVSDEKKHSHSHRKESRESRESRESKDSKDSSKDSKDSKERKKSVKQEFGSTESLEDKKVQRKEKKNSGDKKKEEISEVKHAKDKVKIEAKKENGHDSESDSDSEPKKHSIFDVVLDEPAYISMYDKVKARSCKNMQKQEEEKRQVKLKEKFNQLKQSRAKREEKKRSTSWDEDSDSDESQIRRIPRRSFSRLSSDDEGVTTTIKREKKASESWSTDKRSKKSYDTSEDEGIKMKTVLHTSDVYSDDSDAGFAENGDKPHKFRAKSKSKNVFDSSEEETVKKQRHETLVVAKETFPSVPKPEKIGGMDCKNKVRLSLDSSTDRFCHESKVKKRTPTESMSEGEPSYHHHHHHHHSSKSSDKVDKKKSKKKEKRQKSVEEDSKSGEGDFTFTEKTESEHKPSKEEKKERRKSLQSGNEDNEDSSKHKKSSSNSSKSSKGGSQYDLAIPKNEDHKYERIFDDFSDESNDRLLQLKAAESAKTKWQVAQVYGTDSDSNIDAGDHTSSGKPKKSKDKKKRDKKNREHSVELLEAGRALEKMLSSPSSRRNSEDMLKYCGDSAEDFGEMKLNKEKKKKRKKSRDEKSSRHHHHHHHSSSEKNETVAPESKPIITSSVSVPHVSPSLPSLLDMPSSPSGIKQEPPSPVSPRLPTTANSKTQEKMIPGFGYEIDEKVHESAVQSIAMLDVTPKTEPKIETKDIIIEETIEKKDENKERVVISQEETEDAVAALLGETFTYSSCFEGNSPVETDPEPHDEEEMRQAVQSLNESKPDTPQSESGLQIDTDAEDQDEQFTGLRFESIPRTPDLDLSQPPKTPDIQPSYETKPVVPFARKDTTRNSREEMEVPIVSPPSPDPLVSYENDESEPPKEKDVDLKPPILKPASPKLFKDEPPPIIEPVSSLGSSERIFVDNRLLLHPPPLIPVAKQIPTSPPKPSPSLSIVRPIISISTSTTSTLVLTPIRAATPINTSISSSTIPRKTFTIATTSPSIITTRATIQPPVLSPVTPSALTSPIRLSPSTTEPSSLSVASRFNAPATMVSSQHVPGHLLPQKIILQQVPRPTPTRLVTTPASVVKVVDSVLNVQPTVSSGGDMPALTLPEPVKPTQTTLSTQTSPPPSLGLEVGSTSTPSFEKSRPEVVTPQPASVISVLPRSLPVSVPPQPYSRITTIATATTTAAAVEMPVSSAISSVVSAPSVQTSTTSVISIHTAATETKKIILNCQSVTHPEVLPTSKVVPITSVQSTVVPEVVAPLPPPCPASVPAPVIATVSAPAPTPITTSTSAPVSTPATTTPVAAPIPTPVPEVKAPELDTVLPVPPRPSSVIETKVSEEKNTHEVQLTEVKNRVSEQEKPDEDKRSVIQKELIEPAEVAEPEELKNKEKACSEDHSVIRQPQSQQHDSVFKSTSLPSVEVVEHTESVIKKVDSVSSLKSEESINEVADAGDKHDTSSSTNLDDSMRSLSSEEENKQVNSIITRKGRKKGNRGGMMTRKAKQGTGNKVESPMGKRGGKAQKAGKMVNDLGKKQSKDVYEFHDESDEDGSGEKERPRLILTIKSPNSVKDQPVVPPKPATAPSKSPNPTKSPKEGGLSAKSPEQKAPVIEKDVGAINTRKSRRLLEKDGYRNTVDDVIEDVVRNNGTRNATSPRRSLRQVTKSANSNPPVVPLPKKVMTRTAKKSIGCASTDDEMKDSEVSAAVKTTEPAFAEEKEVTPAPKVQPPSKDEPEVEGETSDEEPTTLIDPVTGMLMVMRAKEEGKYVPVPNVPPIAPPTPPPPPPPVKADVLPIVTEGLASHWLSHETLKQQAVIKVQNYGETTNKVSPGFMNRPPTPPTTPQARIQEPVTRLPVDMIKKVVPEQILEPEPAKPEPDMNKILLQPMELSKQKMCHMEPGKIYPEINRVEYADPILRNASSESGKIYRQLAKPTPQVPPPTLNKGLCAKGVAILASPNKQLYQNPKHIKMSPQNQILTGAVASSPPRVVKTTPPAHELHPMTGAVASPPPRAPHLTSQQPIVTGASSSRALVDAPMGPGASPRGMTIPPYEATLQTPTQTLHSPPPAHQQGEGINMGHLGHPPFVHPQLMYQQYLRAQEMLPSPYQLTASLQGKLVEERERERGAGDMGRSPPLELRTPRATDSPTVYMGRQQYTRYYDEPPPAHLHVGRHIHQAPDAPGQPRLQIATPPHASQVPPQADSLLMLLQRYPIMWQGLLALKNDQSAVQMHFVFGNPHVARDSLPCNSDGSTPPLRIAQRMRLEQTQLEGVARKMQMDNEHCMLLALPCGRDHMDVLQQSTNLQTGFITYLQQKQAAGIVNIAHPGSQQAAYVVHIFPSCEFANENLARNAPDLLHRMQEIPHLVIVIATV